MCKISFTRDKDVKCFIVSPCKTKISVIADSIELIDGLDRPYYFFGFRFENYRGCSNRICEEPARCDYFNCIFTVCLWPPGTPNIHGSPDSEMHPDVRLHCR